MKLLRSGSLALIAALAAVAIPLTAQAAVTLAPSAGFCRSGFFERNFAVNGVAAAGTFTVTAPGIRSPFSISLKKGNNAGALFLGTQRAGTFKVTVSQAGTTMASGDFVASAADVKGCRPAAAVAAATTTRLPQTGGGAPRPEPVPWGAALVGMLGMITAGAGVALLLRRRLA